MARGRQAFTTLADLFVPHVWATNAQGELLDHLLAVDEATYALILDAETYEVWSLTDALAQPWEDLDAQAAWVAVYAELLDEEWDMAQKRLDAASMRRRLLEAATNAKKSPS